MVIWKALYLYLYTIRSAAIFLLECCTHREWKRHCLHNIIAEYIGGQ
jgi:hypothetical protein